LAFLYTGTLDVVHYDALNLVYDTLETWDREPLWGENWHVYLYTI